MNKVKNSINRKIIKLDNYSLTSKFVCFYYYNVYLRILIMLQGFFVNINIMN